MEKPIARLNYSNEQVYKNDHAFRKKKPETEEIDDEIIEWILMNRKLGIAVTSWEVIVKACSMKEELKKK